MIDPTPNEKAAMAQGGARGGEYLEAIGTSDLAHLSPDQWRAFIEVIVTGYCDCLRQLAGQDRDRLDGISERVPF